LLGIPIAIAERAAFRRIAHGLVGETSPMRERVEDALQAEDMSVAASPSKYTSSL
jgi:hypothetical protein